MTTPPAPQPKDLPRDMNDAERHLEESLASVREALTGLRFGMVALTVHEGRVVQIDVTEKKRLKPN
ncbi:MAG: YezD family protein [Novosphingobium sp.]